MRLFVQPQVMHDIQTISEILIYLCLFEYNEETTGKNGDICESLGEYSHDEGILISWLFSQHMPDRLWLQKQNSDEKTACI